MAGDLKVVADCYDLAVYLSRRVEKFPRSHRYTLGADSERRAQGLLGDLVRARYAVLKDQFRRLFKDGRLLALMDRIVDSSNDQEAVTAWFPGDDLFTPATRRKGLPIGNLTSQWFANWYLTAFDYHVTDSLKCGYVRYCDDFILLSDSRRRLREIVPELVERLSVLRLKRHRDRIHVAPSGAGRTFVGYRVAPFRRRIGNGNVRSFLGRLGRMRRAFDGRRLSCDAIHRRLMGWLGHAAQADSLPLIARLATGWVFRRGRFQSFRRIRPCFSPGGAAVNSQGRQPLEGDRRDIPQAPEGRRRRRPSGAKTDEG